MINNVNTLELLSAFVLVLAAGVAIGHFISLFSLRSKIKYEEYLRAFNDEQRRKTLEALKAASGHPIHGFTKQERHPLYPELDTVKVAEPVDTEALDATRSLPMVPMPPTTGVHPARPVSPSPLAGYNPYALSWRRAVTEEHAPQGA